MKNLKSIKVLHTEWSDGWGGQEIRIINEALALRQMYGVETVIACRRDAQIAQKALENGFEVVYLPFSSSFDIKSILGVKRLVKQLGIDIVNTHSGKDTWVGGLGAKLAGVKFIRTRHLSNKINPSRLNFINELADFVITTGSSVRDAMIEQNRIKPENIASIPTGIDESLFDSSKFEKDESLDKFSLSKDKIYVGMLSVLRSVKCHDLFLRLALKAHESFKNAHFLIAGEGPMRGQIEEFIRQNNMQSYVSLLGNVNDTPEFLNALDIFMITSKAEGVPQSLMQALLMQKACIATDVGSVKDLYDGGNFLLTKFDEAALQSALNELLGDEIKRRALEQNARKFVSENFTKSIMAKRVYEIYLKLLG